MRIIVSMSITEKVMRKLAHFQRSEIKDFLPYLKGKCYVKIKYLGGAGLIDQRLCVPSLGDVEVSKVKNCRICCSSIRKTHSGNLKIICYQFVRFIFLIYFKKLMKRPGKHKFENFLIFGLNCFQIGFVDFPSSKFTSL